MQKGYRDDLGGKDVIIIPALTIEEAEVAFFANPDVDLIVLDFRVPGRCYSTTFSLAKMIRKTFKGPMIAASSDSSCSDVLK